MGPAAAFDLRVTDGRLVGVVEEGVKAAERVLCPAQDVVDCVFWISAAVNGRRVNRLKPPAPKPLQNYRRSRKLINKPLLTKRHGSVPKLKRGLSKKTKGKHTLKPLLLRQTRKPSKSVKQPLTVKRWNRYRSRKQLENVSLIFNMITI